MPKRPAHAEDASMALRFRKRLGEEMQRRGMSDVGLSKRLAEHGIKMAPGTIWKIKHGEPPRKVDLDEAHAVARVFGYDTVEEFLHHEFYAAERAAFDFHASLFAVQTAVAQAARRLHWMHDAVTRVSDAAYRERERADALAEAERVAEEVAADLAVIVGALHKDGRTSTQELIEAGDKYDWRKPLTPIDEPIAGKDWAAGAADLTDWKGDR